MMVSLDAGRGTRLRLAQVALAIFALLTWTGCAGLQVVLQRFDRGGDPAGEGGGAGDGQLYAGAECHSRPRVSPNSVFAAVNPREPPKEQVLDLICLPTSPVGRSRYGGTSHGGFPELHQRFDDRRPDPLLAGIIVADCVRSGGCRLDEDPAAVAMMAGYLPHLEPGALARQAHGLGLSPAAEQAFVELVATAKRQVEGQLGRFNPTFRRIFLEVPQVVQQERQAYFARYAALYQELDERSAALFASLPDTGKLRAQIDLIEALRERYLTECKDPRCVFDPLFMEATLTLAEAEHVAGWSLELSATVRVLSDKNRVPTHYAHAIYERQMKEVVAHNQRREAWDKEQKAGVPPAVLAAKYPGGEPDPRIPTMTVYEAGDPLYARLQAILPERSPIPQAGRVRSLSKAKPGLTRATFHDEEIKYESADCRPTQRIIRYDYDRDGSSVRPVYEEICGPSTTVREYKKLEPVLLPEREAKALRPGQTIYYLSDGEEARLLESFEGERPLTLRGLRLPAAANKPAGSAPVGRLSRGR